MLHAGRMTYCRASVMLFVRTWVRRLSMIALYVAVWALFTALLPILAPGAVIHGLIGRNRFALLRLTGAVWVFFVAELCGVAVAFWTWLGLVLGRDREGFLARNYRLQQWWARFILGAIFWLLELHLEVEGDERAAPGPIVLFMNHASVIDTLLPVDLVCREHGMRLRYVLKKELLIDPCLDIVGNRLPNYFVDRSGVSETEIGGIRAMVGDLGERDGIMIYPEGTRFSSSKRERALARLETRDPELHERARSLVHVLPPRPGGALALLDEARRGGIDVVFCAHSGMKGFASVREMLSGEIIGNTVQVNFWRVSAAEIPASSDEQIDWLYDQWIRVDTLSAEIAERRARAA